MDQEKPTSAQLKTISIIEENLRLTFNGDTKKEATDFISAHIDASKNVITANQKNVLAMIESNTGVKFTGKTKQEATDFISANMDVSVSLRNKHNAENYEKLIEEYRRDRELFRQQENAFRGAAVSSHWNRTGTLPDW